jgi:hypothetical protein
MQSKGAKKSLKAKIPNNADIKKYDKESPGALNLNYFIKVKNKEDQWKKSKIVECRLDRAIFGERRLEEVREDPDVKLQEDSYEYYIHYDHMNRRLDEWVKRDRIKPTH